MNYLVEEAVLGGVLLWEGPWPQEVLEVDPEFFADVRHVKAWEAIRSLMADGETVDELTVSDRLRSEKVFKDSTYLFELVADTPSTAGLVHWLRILIRDGRKRLSRQAMDAAMANLGDDATPADMAKAARDIEKKYQPKREVGAKPISSVVLPVVNSLEQEYLDPNSARCAVSGLKDLDHDVTMRAGDLTIVAGRPSMGKTALAINIAQHCAKDITRGATVVFSLEMSDQSLVRRMLASFGRANLGNLATTAAQGKLVEACEKVHGLNMYIDDRPAMSIGMVRSSLGRIGQKVRLVVFDYVQFARLDEKDDNHSIRIGKITKGLKAIAKEHDCHVIALAQLNRSVESRSPPRPMLSDLRASGEMEEDADNALLLFRPGVYRDDVPSGETEVIIAKQRNGETGFVRVWWDGATQTFSNYRSDR